MALGQNVNNNSYEDMKERHKTKVTTDDCYTPQEIYEAVKDWVIKEYDLKNVSIERPFWPGEDYTKYEYKENSVVIDNPPFSILSKIEKYYNDNNIKYFLFAPGLVTFNKQNNNYIITAANIVYNGEVVVQTNFVTNMGDVFIKSAPDLKLKIEEIAEKLKRKKTKARPRYIYPDNLITAGTFPTLVPISIYEDESTGRISALDSQKGVISGIFGGGFLISTDAAVRLNTAKIQNKQRAEELATIRNDGKPSVVEWKLSERELKLIEELDKKAEEDKE